MNALPTPQPAPALKKRLTLIDGSGFIFRAFFAMPALTRHDGTPTGAVYGFINMMLKLLADQLSDEVDDAVAVIFDAGRHTFRNDLYPEYKANRDEPPEDLRPQFALVRDATRALGLPSIEQAGVEADDIIASYTRVGVAAGYEVVIVSSDKDLMQLVDDAAGIRLYDAMKDRVIDAAAVQEKFGVAPAQVLDVLALMGDSSDNIPGVPGIGPKTAAQLIQEYGDLESLLGRLGEIKQEKRRQTLEEHSGNARLSQQLVRLKEDVVLPMTLEELALKEPDNEALLSFVRDMGFKKIAERLEKQAFLAGSGAIAAPKSFGGASHAAGQAVVNPPATSVATGAVQGQPQYQLVQTEAALRQWIMSAHMAGYVALYWHEDAGTPIGLAMAVTPGQAGYLPLGHVTSKGQNDLFDSGVTLAEGQMPLPQALALLAPMLADPSVLKISTRSRLDIRLMLGQGQTLGPIDDITLMSYCLGAGLYGHSLEEMVVRELGGVALQDEAALLGKGRGKLTAAELDYAQAMAPMAERADITLRLWQVLKRRLFEQKLVSVYERLERTLPPILARMEHCGILVDRQRLRGLSAEFSAQLEQLAAEIYKAAGGEFLIGSPKQLGEVLFERLSLPGGKKSKKSGQYGTGAEILEELAVSGHDIAAKVLEWRQYDKLRNTYTEALERQINPQTGRVHTHFQQTIASTGRLSSTDPNLQNIPIRTEQGKRIRHAFVAAEGYSLLSADYSQIELRLLAEMANIDVLKNAFRQKQDIHAATASQMFGVPLEQMTSELRRRAKTINFGIIYGISAHGLAVRLGIERADAARFIDAYFEHYPGIRRYMEEKKAEARDNGYITTLFGRRVHIAGIQETNYNLRAFAERQAINAPLQGTAADIIKRAMVMLSDELLLPQAQASQSDIRLLLQVHDELVFEIKKGQEDAFAPRVKKIMEQAGHLSVPLVVETGIGHDWGEIH